MLDSVKTYAITYDEAIEIETSWWESEINKLVLKIEIDGLELISDIELICATSDRQAYHIEPEREVESGLWYFFNGETFCSVYKDSCSKLTEAITHEVNRKIQELNSEGV